MKTLRGKARPRLDVFLEQERKRRLVLVLVAGLPRLGRVRGCENFLREFPAC
jgi:hypothetical protein